MTIWSARRRLGWERAYAVAEAFLFDEHRAGQIGRKRRPLPSARLRLLMLASERLAATSAPSLGVDAFLFDDPSNAFAERIALAREGYSCMPADALPPLLADDFRMRQLAQFSEADWRLADAHLHGASLTSTAIALGLSPRQTHAAVRRLLQRLALPTKVGLAALIARARRRPPS